ncbi:GNAT family N-acetyltransferase [Bradyrhizobium sp. HKCCYLS1011]|uniref:GNAT family N-acetyltransferase n=1 Tax=Bradyrhizobium sp. HKCCYLS1011 TaxID=3420733 RepID=UPI003EC064C7
MLTVRPFRADDLDALYRISLATGLAGDDASHLYADPKLIGHIYSAPYALLEPDLAFVVEDQDGVAGFAVGTADTIAWEDRLERLWWPSLREQYALLPQSDPASRSDDQRRIAMIHRPAPTPAAVSSGFPAHLHLNLLPRLRGRGMGARLLHHWLAALGRHGAKATHVAVNRANSRALQFWNRMGFRDLPLESLPEGRTIWMGRPSAGRACKE